MENVKRLIAEFNESVANEFKNAKTIKDCTNFYERNLDRIKVGTNNMEDFFSEEEITKVYEYCKHGLTYRYISRKAEIVKELRNTFTF